MSVSGADFIAIAERIIASEESEIAWRVAAGRAYYGALHCCSDAVQKHPEAILDAKLPTHERIFKAVNGLGKSAIGSSEIKKFTYLTKLLQATRIDADYKIELPFLRTRAEQAILSAKNIQSLREQFQVTHKI